jgi:hypothetical protein
MILAHGSGIDDAAFIVVPILVFAAFRWLNRRQSPQPEEARDNGHITRNDAASS